MVRPVTRRSHCALVRPQISVPMRQLPCSGWPLSALASAKAEEPAKTTGWFLALAIDPPELLSSRGARDVSPL